MDRTPSMPKKGYGQWSYGGNSHPIDYLYFSISLWVEGSQFVQLGVHHQP